MGNSDPVSDMLQQGLDTHVQAVTATPKIANDPVNDMLQQGLSDHLAGKTQPAAPVNQQQPTDKASRYGGLALRSAGIFAGGIADIPSAVLNAGEWAGEKISGNTGTPRAPYPSDYINKAMDNAGVPNPETTGEKVAVYGAPIIAGAAKSLAGGAVSVGKGMLASSPEEMSATQQAIKSTATSAYQKMKDIGANINSDASDTMLQSVLTKLSDSGIFNPTRHPGTASVLDDLGKAVNNSKNAPLSLEYLDQIRREAAGVINGGKIRNMFGQVVGKSEDAQRATVVVKAIDDAVSKLGKADMTAGGTDAVAALNDARSAWSTQRKYQDISRLINDAGGNPNNLKLRLTRIVNDPTKMANYTAAEQQAIKNAALTTGPESMLNLAGKFGVDLGSSTYQGRASGAALTLGAAKMGAGAYAGYQVGGDKGAMAGATAAVVGGTAARQLQKWIASGRAEDVLKIIKSGQKISPDQIGKMSAKNAALYMSAIANPFKKDDSK